VDAVALAHCECAYLPHNLQLHSPLRCWSPPEKPLATPEILKYPGQCYAKQTHPSANKLSDPLHRATLSIARISPTPPPTPVESGISRQVPWVSVTHLFPTAPESSQTDSCPATMQG
jgi:hypothetical protein